MVSLLTSRAPVAVLWNTVRHLLILVLVACLLEAALPSSLPDCSADFAYDNSTINNSTDGELGGLCLPSNLSCSGDLMCCQAQLSPAVNLCQPKNASSASGCSVENGGCSDVCLPGKYANSSICVCSDYNTKLDSSDNKTCAATDICPEGFSFLVMSRSTSTTKCVMIQEGKVDYTGSVFNCLVLGLGPLTLETQKEVDWLANIRKVRPEYDVDLWLAAQVTESEGDSVSWTTEYYSLTKPKSYTNWLEDKPECTTYDGCHMVSNHRDNTWSMVHYSGTKDKDGQNGYACQTIRVQDNN